MTIDANSYTLCASYAGIVGSGQTVTLNFDTTLGPGLFVLVHIPGASERLTLCEVQVFGIEGKIIAGVSLAKKIIIFILPGVHG